MDNADLLVEQYGAPNEDTGAIWPVKLFLYVTTRPTSNNKVEFSDVTVDGKLVSPIVYSDLPGNQGVAMRLGLFEPTQNIAVAWKFRTGALGWPRDAALGVYRDSPKNRTILRHLMLDAFATYEGSDNVSTSLAVPPPPPTIPPDPSVKIETTYEHDKCGPLIQAVLLNNYSVKKYRVIILRQREYDEYRPYVLEHNGPQQKVWIGCVNDGYSYSIFSTTAI